MTVDMGKERSKPCLFPMGTIRLVISVVVVWALVAAMSLWPLGVWPRTPFGWVLLLVLGPFVVLLLSLAAEMAGNALASVPEVRHADLAVERRTANRQFSPARIAYYLVRALVILVPIILALLWLRSDWSPVPDAFAELWRRHFN